jgi:soluble lytic murein transglycosylase-like protein
MIFWKSLFLLLLWPGVTFGEGLPNAITSEGGPVVGPSESFPPAITSEEPAKNVKPPKVSLQPHPMADLFYFMGDLPRNYSLDYKRPAQKILSARKHWQGGNHKLALSEVEGLVNHSQWSEHALALAMEWRRRQKEYLKSNEWAERLLIRFPQGPYAELAQDHLEENDCDGGGALAKGNPRLAETMLERCLGRISWREWAEHEAAVVALYEIYQKRKDSLLPAFVAEVFQALPQGHSLRARIQKDHGREWQRWTEVARMRMKGGAPSGVKPVNPDGEAFDNAIQAVFVGKWSEAETQLIQMLEQFPNTEHLDRAHYWLARASEALGKKDEAKRRFEQIYSDNPLSYYGLQAGLRLEKDFSVFAVRKDPPKVRMVGQAFLRQQRALFRLRALLELGLLAEARQEARALSQSRPGGFAFGQQSPEGALFLGYLYHQAGFPLGAFSHVHASIGLDQALLDRFSLEMLFPGFFRPEIEKASDETGIDPLLLLSLTKQESAFLPNAISRANALGLMQLLFTTAQEVDPKVNRDTIFDPSVNTLLGAKYLQKLLERNGGNIALALAGYNAGPSRAIAWQKKMQESPLMQTAFDTDLFIDTIPFTETRRYVGSILRNLFWYRLLESREPIRSVDEVVTKWQK